VYRILTLIPLTWKIWWARNNASGWQMGFNSAFKGLKYFIKLEGEKKPTANVKNWRHAVKHLSPFASSWGLQYLVAMATHFQFVCRRKRRQKFGHLARSAPESGAPFRSLIVLSYNMAAWDLFHQPSSSPRARLLMDLIY